MGGNKTAVKSGHGLSGAGKGHPPMAGVTGPGGSFVGTVNPQDPDRTAVTHADDEVDEVGGKKVPKNVGMKTVKTGGMSRKGNGNVGPGGYKGRS